MNNNEILNNILSCQDLWVILENRFGRQYVESYHLTNILIAGEEFWGKFSNVHSSDPQNGINPDKSLSYAYNNFSNVVCSMCLDHYLERYYSSYTYSTVKFITKNTFKKIWSTESGGDTSDIRFSVENGCKLKCLIESTDGYIYIVNCHTVEVYDEGFSVQTNYEGYPDRLRHFQSIKALGNDFDASLKDSRADSSDYPATKFYECSYFLTSFIVKSQGKELIHRVKIDGGIKRINFDYKKIEVWSE